MSLEVRWLYCQEFLDSVAGGSLGQIGFLNLLLEALSVKLKSRVQKTWSVRQRCEMSCICFWHFLHLNFGVFVTFLRLKMFALAFQVVSVEDVCTCISFSCQFVHLCAFHFFAESCLGVKLSRSEAVQQ